MVNIIVVSVCGIILLLFLISFVFSLILTLPALDKAGAKSLREDSGLSLVLLPFYLIAYTCRAKLSGRKKTMEKMQKESRMKRRLKIINPSESVDIQLLRYESTLLAEILLCIFIGSLLCLFLTSAKMLHPTIGENNTLVRAEYGEGSKEADLVVTSGDIEEKMHIVIHERTYGEEEIQAFLQEAEDILPGLILGENASVEHIQKPLTLIKEMEGNPFSITWDSSDYSVVDLDGQVHNEELEEAQLVTLTACLSYLSIKNYIPVNVVVEPHIFSPEEKAMMEITEALERNDLASADKQSFILPRQVEESGMLSWREEQSMDCLWILGLVLLAIVGISVSMENDLNKKMKIRDAELLAGYSELINKLTLYMSAGMTIRNTFIRLMEEYEKQRPQKKAYLYEEVTMTCYEIQTGVSEAEAYENFGKRCSLRQYVRLSAMLTQSLKKGSTNLISALQQESKDAFDARKNIARRLGEEAGTKILVPMIMMLGVVLVMIMIPAYLSFSL